MKGQSWKQDHKLIRSLIDVSSIERFVDGVEAGNFSPNSYSYARTAIHAVIQKGTRSQLIKLIGLGADPNGESPNRLRESPVFSTLPDAKKLKCLLECGVQIDARDSNGATVFHRAASIISDANMNEIIEFLKIASMYSSLANVEDEFGKTYVDILGDKGFHHAVRTLDISSAPTSPSSQSRENGIVDHALAQFATATKGRSLPEGEATEVPFKHYVFQTDIQFWATEVKRGNWQEVLTAAISTTSLDRLMLIRPPKLLSNLLTLKTLNGYRRRLNSICGATLDDRAEKWQMRSYSSGKLMADLSEYLWRVGSNPLALVMFPEPAIIYLTGAQEISYAASISGKEFARAISSLKSLAVSPLCYDGNDVVLVFNQAVNGLEQISEVADLMRKLKVSFADSEEPEGHLEELIRGRQAVVLSW